MSKGFFITLEGGEGAGKSTQIKRLAGLLTADGRDVVTTREPGGSTGAEQIRELLLETSSELDAISQALLFAAARNDHLRATIRPALGRGAVVLCDRFMDSTRAYQGAAGDVPVSVIDSLEKLVVGTTQPDLTFILDLPTEIGLARAAARRGNGQGDPFELRGADFHRKVRVGFLEIAKACPARCVVVDASAGADQVFAAIKREVTRRLPERAA